MENKFKNIFVILILFCIAGFLSVYFFGVIGYIFAKDDKWQEHNYTQTCKKASDCGVTGFTGDSYCKNGNVYSTRIIYICVSQSPKPSHCADMVEPDVLKTACRSDQTCINATCTYNPKHCCFCGYQNVPGCAGLDQTDCVNYRSAQKMADCNWDGK